MRLSDTGLWQLSEWLNEQQQLMQPANSTTAPDINKPEHIRKVKAATQTMTDWEHVLLVNHSCPWQVLAAPCRGRKQLANQVSILSRSS